MSAHSNGSYREHSMQAVWSYSGIAADSAVTEDTLLHTDKSTYHTSEPIVIVAPVTGALSTKEFVFAQELGGFDYSIWRRAGKAWSHVHSNGCAGCTPEFIVLPSRLRVRPIDEPGEYKLEFHDRDRHRFSTAPFSIVR